MATLSWHCHQPHRLQAGVGQQAWASRPPFLALGPASPLPSPEGHCHWGHCSPPLCSGPSLPPFLPHLPAPGPRHVDFASWRLSLELSLPGPPSSTFQPLPPCDTSFLPGNRTWDPGPQLRVEPSPPLHIRISFFKTQLPDSPAPLNCGPLTTAAGSPAGG